jgi:exosortase E/protease (VPEID-CTERM system)
MDPASRILGVDQFKVQVFGPCSGYEGLAVTAVFIAGYMWVFQRSLRFPNALVLFPAAMAIIWLLNALRIALLVMIGANVSPEIALGGFHSQFGWVCFLLVAISILVGSQRISFVSRSASENLQTSNVTGRETDYTLLFLAPFIALTASHIFARLFAPHDYVLYPLKVAAIATVIWIGRKAYLPLLRTPSVSAACWGTVIGVVWIATDSGVGSSADLERWIGGLSPVAFSIWLAFRAFGSICLVPVAEELAFRGYLYRTIISSKFEQISFASFSWTALLISSAAFGAMHTRWLAAAIAGVAYALLMIRRGRLSDAIAAHAASNCVVIGWAVFTQQWSLL